MDDIESQSGMIPAIQSGRIQEMILDQAYKEQIEIQSGERVIVGFNRFQSDEGKRKLDLYRPNPQDFQRQVERLHRVKAERDGEGVQHVLSELRQAAQGKENLMPYLIEAVRQYATLGEMTALLKEVFGEFREPVNI